jgi:hypothetical protein
VTVPPMSPRTIRCQDAPMYGSKENASGVLLWDVPATGTNTRSPESSSAPPRWDSTEGCDTPRCAGRRLGLFSVRKPLWRRYAPDIQQFATAAQFELRQLKERFPPHVRNIALSGKSCGDRA